MPLPPPGPPPGTDDMMPLGPPAGGPPMGGPPMGGPPPGPGGGGQPSVKELLSALSMLPPDVKQLVVGELSKQLEGPATAGGPPPGPGGPPPGPPAGLMKEAAGARMGA